MHIQTDVCIIGAGVIGCAIARELSRLDLSIVVLEKNSDVSEGTTKANSAIVHSGYDAKPGSLKARYNVAGNKLFKPWSEELDSPYLNNTSLVVTFSQAEFASLAELQARGRENGVTGLHILDEAALRQREPHIGPLACGALLAETGGICSPYELTSSLADHAAVNGVRFLRNCQVHAIRKTAEGFSLHTTAGTIDSRIVVNAAGVYADGINNQLSEDRFTITPRRGEYWMIDKTFGPTFAATIFQMPTAMGKGILVTPTVEGTVILGPTAEDIQDKEDTRTTAAKLEEILQVAAKSWADIPQRSFITSFAGLRAHVDRNDFIVGEAPDVPGLINAAGIESPGLTAAPAIAVELAELVRERLQAGPKTDFRDPVPKLPVFRNQNNAQRNALIASDPAYGRIICRCEQVSEAEIRAAIHRPVGATTVDGVKRRVRAGMGRCQGSFCLPRVLAILSEELGVSPLALTKYGRQSNILTGRIDDRQEVR